MTAALRRLTTTADTVRTTGRLDVDVPATGNDEVSRLGAAFGSMLDSLDRSRAEQRRLVQDAGHELRTPLTSLRTNLDVLRRHPDLPVDDRQQIMADLHSEVAEMVDLVDEIVTVASGVAADEAATGFSLGDVVSAVVERFQRRTGRRFTLSADESPVHAQQAAIERAVSNLLDNAAKFDDSGQPIEVRVDAGTVAVRDHGPGIPAADLAVVFDRFHRAATAQALPGSGLGLSIVRDVVERNDGTVWAENGEDGGAVVGFRLPGLKRSGGWARLRGAPSTGRSGFAGDRFEFFSAGRQPGSTSRPERLRLSARVLTDSDACLGSLTRRAISLDRDNRAAGATPAMKEGTEMTNPRRIAGGIAAAVLGGGASAALLLGPATTSASTPTSTEVAATVDEPDDTTATAEEGGDTAVPTEEAGEPGSFVRELLQPLVDDGTLTAEQADAIAAQLPMNMPGQNGPGVPGEPGGRGDRPFRHRCPRRRRRSHRRGHRHRRHRAA